MQQLVGTVDSDEVTTVHAQHRNKASPPKQSDRDRNPLHGNIASMLIWADIFLELVKYY